MKTQDKIIHAILSSQLALNNNEDLKNSFPLCFSKTLKARTLKDVYIKVTEKNRKELERITKHSLTKNTYLEFIVDDTLPLEDTEEPKHKQKVSLSELKRLIETIPTRYEITRLKRQISAYKTNLIVCKGDIEGLRNTINQLHDDERKVLEIFSNINNENTQLHKMHDDLKEKYFKDTALLENEISEYYNEKKLLKNLYDAALKEIERFKQQKEVTDNIIHGNHDKIKFLNSRIDTLIWDINRVKLENEQLKQRKWWQIWK